MIKIDLKNLKNKIKPQEMLKKIVSVLKFNKLKILGNQLVNKIFNYSPDNNRDDDKNDIKKKNIPKPKLRVSVKTLVEIERWAERARIGKTAKAFGPVLIQAENNGDVLDNVIHALTLAQIMPYQEVKRYLIVREPEKVIGDLDLVCDLAKQYQTSRENVVERLNHVRLMMKFKDEKKRNKKISAIVED